MRNKITKFIENPVNVLILCASIAAMCLIYLINKQL